MFCVEGDTQRTVWVGRSGGRGGMMMDTETTGPEPPPGPNHSTSRAHWKGIAKEQDAVSGWKITKKQQEIK